MPFPDPVRLEGNPAEILDHTPQIRDAIKSRMTEFIAWVGDNEENPLPPAWKVR
jgi:hypothetical protein